MLQVQPRLLYTHLLYLYTYPRLLFGSSRFLIFLPWHEIVVSKKIYKIITKRVKLQAHPLCLCIHRRLLIG